MILLSEDAVAALNREIATAMAALRRAEKRHGCEYTMHLALNARGAVQMHVAPKDDTRRRC